ncbi:hypothetical protein [Maioricimonas sp. JC845]|uniref:hypothetical protein n=1 Tax=Maioricimonas sp. JC845 TaxID=3232138 RepID=UPI00345A5C4E
MIRLIEGPVWLHDFAARGWTRRLSRPRLVARQQRRFRRLAEFVWNRSPFYRQIMLQRGLRPEHCQPGDFPIVTKSDLIERFDEMVTSPALSRARIRDFLERSTRPTELLDGRYYILRSSGTSGNYACVAYSWREWIRGTSHQIRFAGGLRLRKRCAFIGCTNGHFAGATLGLTGQRGINRLLYDCRGFHVGRPLDELVEELNAFQPHLVSGYAATLCQLALEQAAGRLAIHPFRIVNSGEPLTATNGQFIEDTFRARIADVWACSEMLFMGASGAAGGPMTLYEDDLILELFDDHVLVTNLFNRTTPLIRYRINDVLAPANGHGTDGPFRQVAGIAGRNERHLHFRNNDGSDESVAPYLFMTLPLDGISELQVHQHSECRFTLNVRMHAALSSSGIADALDQANRQVNRLLAGKQLERSVGFTIQVVERLPVDPVSGKARFVVCDCSDQRPGKHHRAA